MTDSRDIMIPEFEIANGWYVADLETEQDCRNAKDILDVAMIGIKDQIARYDAGLFDNTRDAEWRIRAETALRYKRITQQRVHVKLGELTGLRDLHKALEALNRKISHVRTLVDTAPDATLRADIASLVDRKTA